VSGALRHAKMNLFSKAVDRSTIKWSIRESLMNDDVRGWVHIEVEPALFLCAYICVCVCTQ